MIDLTDAVIFGKYRLDKLISNGSFGYVYEGTNNITKNKVAIKLSRESLKHEASIYNYLNHEPGFPKLQLFGVYEGMNCLVMNLYGNTLKNYVEYYRAIPIPKAKNILENIINVIETLHNKLLIHRDLKPSNILFADNCNEKICLIDFGLSVRYTNNNKHIINAKTQSLIGTTNYVSVNVHNGNVPSRRDDMESILYVFLFMIFGKLEWFHIASTEKIVSLKQYITTHPDVPTNIRNMFMYIRQLNFEDKPNYSYLKSLLKTT